MTIDGRSLERVDDVQLTDMSEQDTCRKHYDRWLNGEHRVWVSYCRREDGTLSIIKRTPINFN